MTAKGLVLGALEWKEALRVEHPGHGFVWSEVRPRSPPFRSTTFDLA